MKLSTSRTSQENITVKVKEYYIMDSTSIAEVEDASLVKKTTITTREIQLPAGEVTEIRKNEDGTLTIMVKSEVSTCDFSISTYDEEVSDEINEAYRYAF